ncbi:MAG: hypothetical protein JWM34_4815 [Ilumatobacteraceae bacterium]|nr:hypothetical protein [Ilumatobacteraceae bacterium]
MTTVLGVGSDSYDLQRFVDAQAAVYPRVVSELRSGAKRSHWMWFIFPQIAGLGSSSMAQKYAIADMDEAAAYLAHDVLRARLEECARLVTAIDGVRLDRVLGFPDDLKFHSSMTLFSHVDGHGEVFDLALAKYFNGLPDDNTLALI